MKMGGARMAEPKRKGLIAPWLLIALGLVTIVIVVFTYFWVESTRWYSNPGNTSTAVLILGSIIAAPLLCIGTYFVGRNTKFNDRIDEIAITMKLKEISLLDKGRVPPVKDTKISISNKPASPPTPVKRPDVRNEKRDEGKLEFACPVCETIVTLDDSVCPKCGSEFEEQTVEEGDDEIEEDDLEEIPYHPEPEVGYGKQESTAKSKIKLVMHCSQCGKVLEGGKLCKYCAAKTA